MRTILLTSLLMLSMQKSALSQYGLPIPSVKIVEVRGTDTPFIRVFANVLVDANGINRNVELEKIECSICSDSLISAAKMDALKYAKSVTFPKAVNNGIGTSVRYKLPVLFKYPHLIEH